MAKIKSRKKLIAIATTALLVVGGGSAAFAYWTSTGAGTGSATTGTSTALTVTSKAATGAALVPGGTTPQIVEFTVTNPSTGTQYLTSVTATVANADGSAWTAISGCSAADYSVAVVPPAYGQMAASTTKTGTVQITMNNLPTNQDACKNATVPIYIAAS